MELYLNTYGTYLHRRDDMFEVKIDDTKKRISPKRISSIIISNAAQITTDSIQLALAHNIDILFLDKFGDPYGRIWFPKLGSTTFIRRRLLEIHEHDEGLIYVKHWMHLKTENQINFIKQLLSKRPSLEGVYDSSLLQMSEIQKSLLQIEGSLQKNGGSLMGYEGSISRIYFKILSQLMNKKYSFLGRSSRPAKDQFNTFLNYGYGVLYGKVEKAVIIAGLDPYIGLLHSDSYNKKSLVFDFIEPYRFMIDQTVFYLFSRGKVKDIHTTKIFNGFTLNDDGKRLLITDLMENFDKKIRHGNKNMKQIATIQADAHAFANYLIGKRKGF